MFRTFMNLAGIVALVGLALCPMANAQVDPFAHKTRGPVKERPDRLFPYSFDAATRGLGDVKRLVPSPDKSQRTNDEYEEYAIALGFDSAQQAGGAQLGGSLSIYVSRLDSFKDASPGMFENLLTVTGRVMYTLHVNGTPKSSVTVARDPQTSQWRAVEWGSRKLITMIERERIRHPGISFLLLISPQNPWGLRFVGEERSGQFFLTPLTDIKEIDLKGGEEVSTVKLVPKLRALASQSY